MRYFTPRLNQEQMVSGLGAAVAGMLLFVVVLVTDALMWRHGMRWVPVGIGFGVAAVPGVIITHSIRSARQGRVTVGPDVFFVATACSSLALVFGQLGTHAWSGDAYLAALVLPCIFYATGGDWVMITFGLVVTAVEVGVDLSVDHLGATAFASRFLFYVSIDGLAALMVAPSIHRLHHRFRSREAVSAVAGALATAETVAEALDRVLPLVHTVVPCGAVSVVARTGGATTGGATTGGATTGGSGWRTLAQWSYGGIPMPIARPSELPDLQAGGGPVVVGGRCFIPLGFTPSGELIMVIEQLRQGRLLPSPVREAAEALGASLAIGFSRLGYVAGLKHESRTDPLTGLANRRALEERLTVELARSARTGAPVSVALLDLDHFKAYNDRFGHRRGDEMLQAASAAMRGRLRAGDLLARYGGEEFCVVLPDTPLAPAQRIMDEVRRLAEPAEGPTADGAGQPTMSAGVAEWDRTETAAQLLERADRALYEAKGSGRDRVVAAGGRAPSPSPGLR